MSDDIVLSLTNATKLYAGVPAIEGVDFDLRRGEIHALVGTAPESRPSPRSWRAW